MSTKCSYTLLNIGRLAEACVCILDRSTASEHELFVFTGPLCKNKHIRRVMCQNYLCGFCLDGPNCKYVQWVFCFQFLVMVSNLTALEHITATSSKKFYSICVHVCSRQCSTCLYLCCCSSPQFDIPQPDPVLQAKKNAIICHTCGESGHKAMYCPKISRYSIASIFRRELSDAWSCLLLRIRQRCCRCVKHFATPKLTCMMLNCCFLQYDGVRQRTRTQRYRISARRIAVEKTALFPRNCVSQGNINNNEII